MYATDDRDLFDLPEIELIDGIEVPKMSPRTRHSLLQAAFSAMLREWARGRGKVGTEWRFRLSGSPGRENSYVPDIAYVSNDRLKPLSGNDAEEPPFAPNVAVEIDSPGDRASNVRRKIERYLQNGADLVLEVRPESRTLAAHDLQGERIFSEPETFEHPALDGLRFSVAALFAEADLTP